MIISLTLWDWIKLVGSLILFMGPGLLLLSLIPTSKKLSISMRLILGFGLSLGLWIIQLIWLQLFNISLNKWAVRIIFLLIFSLLLVRLVMKRRSIADLLKGNQIYSDLLIIAFSIFVTVLYLYFYRELVAGMGSDSMHHTLISSLILKNGQLPNDYGPYAPVATFSYHFGYHTFIAALSWLSGISTRLMVVLSGAILMGLASLAGSALVYYLSKRVLFGLLGGAIIGIIYVFPSYSLLWGRSTQLMGTIMLMIFITGLIYWNEQEKFSLKLSSVLMVISVGLIFSHYRICITGIIFAVLYLLLHKIPTFTIKEYILSWAAVPVGALLLSSPWLIQLILDRMNGLNITGGHTNDSFFSLVDRLGSLFQNEMQTWLLIGLSLFFILIGLIVRKRIILIISSWLLVICLLTRPMILGYRVDPVTMMVSSYVPIIMLIGIGLSIVADIIKNKHVTILLNATILLFLLIGINLGIKRWKSYDFSQEAFVTYDDLEAADWIKGHTDSGSLFHISTYQFPINDHLIIGLDAGYWLPVIADRQTLIPPMVYLMEKTNKYQVENDPVKFHLLNDNIASSDAANVLREAGVDYIYIGARGGNINLESLSASGYYELIYQQKGINIFKVLP